MPIKEIVTWAMVICGGWYAIGGQKGMMMNIRKAQIAILKEVGRTDNWGNPSIFPRQKHISEKLK
jgi:hypothetical protein